MPISAPPPRIPASEQHSRTTDTRMKPSWCNVADVSPDVLEAVAVTCVKCWKETHQPPPATALYLMDDYKWEIGHQVRLENETAQLAPGDGYQGTLDALPHAAHRATYARGAAAPLAKMLGHVA